MDKKDLPTDDWLDGNIVEEGDFLSTTPPVAEPHKFAGAHFPTSDGHDPVWISKLYVKMLNDQNALRNRAAFIRTAKYVGRMQDKLAGVSEEPAYYEGGLFNEND